MSNRKNGRKHFVRFLNYGRVCAVAPLCLTKPKPQITIRLPDPRPTSRANHQVADICPQSRIVRRRVHLLHARILTHSIAASAGARVCGWWRRLCRIDRRENRNLVRRLALENNFPAKQKEGKNVCLEINFPWILRKQKCSNQFTRYAISYSILNIYTYNR